MQKKVLIPLPTYGFDPTEAAVPFVQMQKAGISLFFATPNATVAKADEIMLNGKGLFIWKNILKARKDAVIAYNEMIHTENFLHPISYAEINPEEYDGLLLPGGHHKGVKEYLESSILQEKVNYFFELKKEIAAICHGVVLAARSKNKTNLKSVLWGYKTTALLKRQECLAYQLTRGWMKDYYLTYPGLTVQDEVTAVLENSTDFISGKNPLFRDSEKKLQHGFALRDRNYLSARWPGDVYSFSKQFIEMIHKTTDTQ